MSSPKSRRLLILRLILAAVFLIAGAAKLYGALQQYQHPIQTDTMQNMFDYYLGIHSPVRYIFIAAELFLGFWLFIGIFPRIAVSLALLLLIIFSALIAWELTKDNPLACGCAGSRTITLIHDIRLGLALALARNLVLMLIAAHILDRSRHRPSPAPSR